MGVVDNEGLLVCVQYVMIRVHHTFSTHVHIMHGMCISTHPVYIPHTSPPPPPGLIGSLACNPQYTGTFAAGCYDGSVGVYDYSTREQLLQLEGHTGGVTQVCVIMCVLCWVCVPAVYFVCVCVVMYFTHTQTQSPPFPLYFTLPSFPLVFHSPLKFHTFLLSPYFSHFHPLIFHRSYGHVMAVISTLVHARTPISTVGTCATPLMPCTACSVTPPPPISVCVWILRGWGVIW